MGIELTTVLFTVTRWYQQHTSIKELAVSYKFEYEIPAPVRPMKPRALVRMARTRISNLTDEEIKEYKKLDDEYTRLIDEFHAVYKVWKIGYNEARAKFEQDFWNELADRSGIDRTEDGLYADPVAQWVKHKAWELGHSSGYDEVSGYFNDLVEVVHIAKNHYTMASVG